MQHGIWWTGLLAVLATLLTTGKAWVDDDNNKRTPASEVSRLHLRVEALERDIQELRALLAERRRNERVLEVEGVAVEPGGLRTTVTVPAPAVQRYYYVYPTCGCGYYYPTAWYYSYPAYYYPTWSWYGW